MDQQTPRKKPVFTKLQAYQKAEGFCAYQERSQQEVRDKLYSWGLHSAEVEDVISDLITHNFINEERFAHADASGKFRMKHWGKIKIRQGLQLKKVSPRLIKEALAQIDAESYTETLTNLLEKKALSLSEKDPYKRKMKLAGYAAGKGYENELIFDLLNTKDL